MNLMEQRQDRREQAVKHFLREYLGKAKDAQTMNCILQDIGRYYDADRAYIFEAHMGRKVFNNTFEWCREGVRSEIDHLQNISADGLECWFEAEIDHLQNIPNDAMECWFRHHLYGYPDAQNERL